MITLTGCLLRGASPAEFTLASVATAGNIPPAPVPGDQQGASAPSAEGQAQLRADSTYRLVSLGDEDLVKYEGKRVSVRGRLAVEAPASPAPQGMEKGVQVEQGPTDSTVAAKAPVLRGFYVQSIRSLNDSCGPL
jgi:hypothetical protein